MTRPIISILIFVFISFFQNVHAQKIESFLIEGANNFSPEDYKNWIGLSDGSALFNGYKDSIKTRIERGLNSSGFFNYEIKDINFSPVDSSKGILIIIISENEPTIINSALCDFKNTDTIFLKNSLDELKGNILKQENLDRVFSNILDRYENKGYPFAGIKLESIYFFEDSTYSQPMADILISIDPGIESKIDSIEISGNNKTKNFVITRSAGISKGELYKQKEIDEIPERLNRLRFFESVAEPDFYFDSRKNGILKISVVEKETNSFDGILGYVPATANNEKGFLTGYLNINLRNLFGTGRSALFRWLQESASSQELEIKYIEPWVLDYPFNIEAGFAQRKQDSTYVQRSIEGKFEFIATQEITASLIFNSQTTISTERKNKSFTVFNSSAFSSGFNLKVDTRDDFYSPRSGILFLNTYKYSSKEITGPPEFLTDAVNTSLTFQRLELDFNFYTSLFDGQVAAIGIHARELRGSDFELSDLYFLGGTSSMRGYREKQFTGNRILWSNLEYRYLLSTRSFAFVFFDTGYFLRNGNEQKNIIEASDFKFGYGFGLNIETPLGVLGVSFALGKGDSFSDGKIHFGIINEF